MTTRGFGQPERKTTAWPYTSRLQKGGALLEDMRHLVRHWNEDPARAQRDAGIRSNILNKGTRNRLTDVYQRAFLPRFVNGPIPNAWRLVRALEDANASAAVLRPVYYWITASAEPLLGDFCRDVLYPRRADARIRVDTTLVLSWLNDQGCPWSPDVATRVARGVLAALRDFGTLQGRARKRLADPAPPLRSFAFIAFCLRRHGTTSRELLVHRDWQLFLLSPEDVERLFLHAHQDRLLEYHAAGSVIQIHFPTDSVEEYARVVAR
ncbi:MAG: BrxA family protein [Vicinamibacterales bacterium]